MLIHQSRLLLMRGARARLGPCLVPRAAPKPSVRLPARPLVSRPLVSLPAAAARVGARPAAAVRAAWRPAAAPAALVRRAMASSPAVTPASSLSRADLARYLTSRGGAGRRASLRAGPPSTRRYAAGGIAVYAVSSGVLSTITGLLHVSPATMAKYGFYSGFLVAAGVFVVLVRARRVPEERRTRPRHAAGPGRRLPRDPHPAGAGLPGGAPDDPELQGRDRGARRLRRGRRAPRVQPRRRQLLRVAGPRPPATSRRRATSARGA